MSKLVDEQLARVTEMLPVPGGWSERVQSAVLCALALTRVVFNSTRGWAQDSQWTRLRLTAENQALKAEVAVLREVVRLLQGRFGKLEPARRPRYEPIERMRILELKAATGWSKAQLAKELLLTPQTIAGWLKRLDTDGVEKLIAKPLAVNRFPDFVAHVVQRLKVCCPTMGRKRIAAVLARASLHVSATSVQRMLRAPVGRPPKQRPPRRPARVVVSPDLGETSPPQSKVVTASEPNHLWHVDLTAIPIVAGFWVPWFPGTLAQHWPFSWWGLVVVDHYSRRLFRVRLSRQAPTTQDICDALDVLLSEHGGPKYIVSDQGAQFRDEYRAWCEARGVKARFGAVGKHGSVAVVERAIRTLKYEGLGPLIMPVLLLEELRVEVDHYVTWYNRHRPHEALAGATPHEVYAQLAPARDGPRFEPRRHYPRGRRPSRCAPSRLRGRRGVQLRLVEGCLEGRKHLPVIALEPIRRRAA